MGLFKKLGAAIKKGVKQISIKNVVKLGTPLLSMIPVVGGLAQGVVSNISASHEAKKLQAQAEADGNAQLAQQYAQQAEVLAQTSGQVVGQVAGNTLSAFAKGATTQMVATASAGFNESVGIAGASAVDSTIKEWFIKHWKHLAIGVVALVAGVLIWKKTSNNGRRPTKYRR